MCSPTQVSLAQLAPVRTAALPPSSAPTILDPGGRAHRIRLLSRRCINPRALSCAGAQGNTQATIGGRAYPLQGRQSVRSVPCGIVRRWTRSTVGLTDEQWLLPSRCLGWDVAAVYAHHSALVRDGDAPFPLSDAAGEPMTAAEVLRRFNAPDGLAYTVAESVADLAVSDAARHTRTELVDRFSVHGPAVVQRLRHANRALIVQWGPAVLTVVETLRIVLLEATVHLLDVQRALGHPPAVPPLALHDTAQFLAEIAPAVEFIEAATGRSVHSPLPVLR